MDFMLKPFSSPTLHSCLAKFSYKHDSYVIHSLHASPWEATTLVCNQVEPQLKHLLYAQAQA